jgi:hypothetical protein
MRFRLALGVSAMVGALVLPAAAYAVPGDRAISNPAPGIFRLDDNNLEPGCFVPGRNAPVDVDSHLVVGMDALSEEAHVSVSDGAWFSVDQVLVASSTDGYKIANTFDTGTSNNDADVDPGQTATGLESGTRFVDQRDIIVCVSGGHGDAVQNEPYNQEDGGLVSAINRPIVAPKVTALGVHPVLGINKFKIGFGYSVEQWYTRPAFETTENGNGLFASVTDPEGIPSPTFGANLPSRVAMFPRPNDFPYDAQRVNDVDEAGEAWFAPDVFDGQTLLARQAGDNTAWVTRFLTQGDLSYSWTLRPSLASPDSKRSATLTDDDYRAWNAAWQAYYRGAGPKPSLPLAPGTNSPTPNTTVIVNLPESRPTSAPQVVVNPASVTVQAPATAPAAAPQAAAKKVASAKQKKAYKRCVKKANAKHSKKARSKARAKCARMPH